MTERTLELGAVDRVILFGGAPLLVELVTDLRAQGGMDVVVYTAPRQAKDPVDAKGTTLAEALQALKQPFTVTEDINTEPSLAAQISATTLGLGLGEAWSFSPAIIAKFGGRLLDFMGIPHPRYRGGAHYTWMILRDDKGMAANLQVINADMVQGEHDTGEIVASAAYTLTAGAQTPADYFTEASRQEAAFVRRFLEDVRAKKKFPLAVPDETKSLFLPRLHTATHGWVDWRWSGADIARFVRAFDSPYPGARTMLDGETVIVRQARALADEAPFHPFISGMVTRVLGNLATVATTSGHLELLVLSTDGKPAAVKPGQRLHTPVEQLERAMTTRTRYDAGGIQGAAVKRLIEPGEEFRGERTLLRLLTLADCHPRYTGWLNDPDVNRYLETRFSVQNEQSIREFVAGMASSTDSYLFAIVALDDGVHVGNLKIGPISTNHSYADVSYFIGDRTRWGKGLATDAIKTSVRIGFDRLKVHRLQAGVYEKNEGSSKALERAGFVLEGRFKQQLKAPDGTWQDHLWYGQVR